MAEKFGHFRAKLMSEDDFDVGKSRIVADGFGDYPGDSVIATQRVATGEDQVVLRG